MVPNICGQQPYAALLPRMDAVIARVNRFQTPALANAINNRNRGAPNFNLSDSDVLRKCIESIAYSQQAQALLVQGLINSGIFHRIFCGYNVPAVANLNHDQVSAQYWGQLGALRFRTKIKAMIGCAQSLIHLRQNHPSLMSYLSRMNIPVTIRSQPDIDAFWSSFGVVQHYFRHIGMPFF
ncbi:MAG: hypothetical protein Q8O76_07625, partial [Chloroflexota bacterium]|nr:hypothetical protein [Chloroflexota bacterium]